MLLLSLVLLLGFNQELFPKLYPLRLLVPLVLKLLERDPAVSLEMIVPSELLELVE
jgi:hypothetical protein